MPEENDSDRDEPTAKPPLVHYDYTGACAACSGSPTTPTAASPPKRSHDVEKSFTDLLAEIRNRYEHENSDPVGNMLDCLAVGINVLDGRVPRGRDIWIAELRQYQADFGALLAEAVRLDADTE